MTTPSPDPEPLLRSPAERVQRAALLDRPAMQAIEAFRCGVEARFGPTPHADPLDGGTDAAVLILLETPGPGEMQPRFVSRDNPTGTARNLRRFSAAAGLPRRSTLLWNVVPWHIHAPGARNRAPRRREIADGLALLPAFLALLPRLRVVVLAGRVAGLAAPSLEGRGSHILTMPHPSPTFVNTAPTIAPRLVATLREAAAVARDGA